MPSSRTCRELFGYEGMFMYIKYKYFIRCCGRGMGWNMDGGALARMCTSTGNSWMQWASWEAILGHYIFFIILG